MVSNFLLLIKSIIYMINHYQHYMKTNQSLHLIKTTLPYFIQKIIIIIIKMIIQSFKMDHNPLI